MNSEWVCKAQADAPDHIIWKKVNYIHHPDLWMLLICCEDWECDYLIPWGYKALILSPSCSLPTLPVPLLLNTIFLLPPTLLRRHLFTNIQFSLTFFFLLCKYSAFISLTGTLHSHSYTSLSFFGGCKQPLPQPIPMQFHCLCPSERDTARTGSNIIIVFSLLAWCELVLHMLLSPF